MRLRNAQAIRKRALKMAHPAVKNATRRFWRLGAAGDVDDNMMNKYEYLTCFSVRDPRRPAPLSSAAAPAACRCMPP